MRREPPSCSGFTLVELLVTVVLIVIVVVMAIPMAGSLNDTAQVDRILEFSRECREAVQRHYADTGRLAVESRDARGASQHGLTRATGAEGWGGPYLEKPSDPAFLAVTGWEIRKDFASGPCRPWGECFLVGTERVARLTGAGQYLALTGVDRETARNVDAALDGRQAADWRRHGEVQWREARGGTLMILLMDV